MKSSLLDLMEGKIMSIKFLLTVKYFSLIFIFYYSNLSWSILLFFFFFSFGAKHVTPRSLSAHFIGNMVCVEGIVTKCKSSAVAFIDWNGVWRP